MLWEATVTDGEVVLRAARVMGEGMGRCGASWRFSRALWRAKWWSGWLALLIVSGGLCGMSPSFVAATLTRRTRDGVWAVAGVEARLTGAVRGPGEVGGDGARRGTVGARGGHGARPCR